MSLVINKFARSSYEILDTYEAGVVLTGSEVKSLRAQSAHLKGAYIKCRRGELFVEGMYIAPYKPAADNGHIAERPRKLLLHKRQIIKITQSLKTPGVTVIPLKFYNKSKHIKVEIAVAKGKKKHDKRATLKQRDAKRRAERVIKQYM
jgi:SsrA-binding protein